MRNSVFMVLTAIVLAACPAPADCPPCPEAGDAATPAAPAAPKAVSGLTAFEQELLNEKISDIRAGVRPFADDSVGICKVDPSDPKACAEYLGREVSELPPGKYILRAEMRVPNAGEAGTWKVKFDTECTTTRVTSSGENTSTSTNSRDYDVRYAGEERGYRMTLYNIESPNQGGARTCDWKLIGVHPDGDKVIEGTWSVPGAE